MSRIGIRTDANEIVATGHVMRCLAVADALWETGEKPVFIAADDAPKSLVLSRGYEFISLGTDWRNLEDEIGQTRDAIKKYRIGAMLVDSYYVTRTYLENLQSMVPVMYMDDLGKDVYGIDALVCYANFWQKFEYEKKYKNTKLCLGTGYAPLKKEFSLCGEKEIKEIPRNLLLLSGGTDPYHALDRILKGVPLERWQRIDVVCGKYNEDYVKLRHEYAAQKRIVLHQNVTNIANFMQDADIAVSAGGVTLYELCAMGTPTVSYAFADNQIDNVVQFAEDGLIEYAGDIRESGVVVEVRDILTGSYIKKEERMRRSQKMQATVDGKGSGRIADVLKSIGGFHSMPSHSWI